MSDGECRICKKINDNYEGCVVTSNSPVCDSDNVAANIQAALSDFETGFTTTPVCVACKKDGKFLTKIQDYLFITKLQIKY